MSGPVVGNSLPPAWRLLPVLALGLLLGGCQLLQPEEQEPEPVPTPPIIEAPVEPAPDIDGATLQDAINRLQKGEPEIARAMLENILAERPGHRVAARLLEQIVEPAEELLGTEYREYRVRPGDSLSALAARYLDDALLFFALARYNEIEHPAVITEGRVLRIPVAPADGEPAPQPLVTDQTDLVATARILTETRRYNEAVSLLVAAARGGNLDESGRLVMLDAGIAHAASLMDEGHLDRSRATIERIRPWADSLPGAGERLADQERRIEAREFYGQAETALDDDDQERAHEQLLMAIEADPDYTEAVEREAALRSDRVARQHERALRAYRDQDLDQAIADWNRVLEIDPDFEPAHVYRDRAMELQRRLDD